MFAPFYIGSVVDEVPTNNVIANFISLNVGDVAFANYTYSPIIPIKVV